MMAAIGGSMPRLFLDCDGVLADFDAYATGLLGMPPREFEARHGAKRFWDRIAGHEDFFYKLSLTPDARELWDAVAHFHPVILTGLPRGGWAAPQKVRWAARHFPGRGWSRRWRGPSASTWRTLATCSSTTC